MALARTRHPYRFTQAEYLAFERASTTRHEYIDGIIYALDDPTVVAMAGESRAHGTIAGNLFASLHAHLWGGPCQAFTKDMKVRLGPNSLESARGFYAYPDIVVVCGEQQYHDRQRDVLLNPTVLIEVLSPFAEGYDRGEKFHGYQQYLATFMDYLLVAQERPLIDHFRHTPSGLWTMRTTRGLDATLHVAALDWTVPFADIYERVAFPPVAEDGTAR